MSDNPPYITTMRGPAGYFVAVMTWSTREDQYTLQTAGHARYLKSKPAKRAAKVWAEDAKMEYRAWATKRLRYLGIIRA